MQYYTDFDNSQPLHISDIEEILNLPYPTPSAKMGNNYTPPLDIDALDELLQEKYPLSDSLLTEMKPKPSIFTGH
jgi:hypothetical protein